MRKEDKLILACARFTVSSKIQSRIESLVVESLDWQYIVQAVTRHGIAYLVYRSLRNCSADIDPDVVQFLRNVVLQNNGRSLHQTGFLLKLLSLFQKQKITVVPFKGPALSQILYGNPAIRSYGDLDILVHVSDVGKASQLLMGQGFVPEISLSDAELLAYTRTEDNIIFHNNELQIVVELHWEITGQYLRYSIGLDCFHDSLNEIEISGVLVKSLASEDLLLYLCIHGTKHMWSRLEWVCCVAELLRVCEFDWQKVLARAKEFRCMNMLLLGLGLASELLDAGLPNEVAPLLEDHKMCELVQEVQKGLFAEGEIVTGGEDRFSFFHIKNRDSMLDGFYYGMSLLFQPTYKEWQAWSLPSSLTFLYYGFRPLRLGWEFFRGGKG